VGHYQLQLNQFLQHSNLDAIQFERWRAKSSKWPINEINARMKFDFIQIKNILSEFRQWIERTARMCLRKNIMAQTMLSLLEVYQMSCWWWSVDHIVGIKNDVYNVCGWNIGGKSGEYCYHQRLCKFGNLHNAC